MLADDAGNCSKTYEKGCKQRPYDPLKLCSSRKNMVKRSGLFEKKGLTFRCKLSFTHGGLLQNLMQEKYGSYTKMYTGELMFLKLVVSQEVFPW